MAAANFQKPFGWLGFGKGRLSVAGKFSTREKGRTFSFPT